MHTANYAVQSLNQNKKHQNTEINEKSNEQYTNSLEAKATQ